MNDLLTKIRRVKTLRDEITARYKELNELEYEIIDEIIETKQQDTYKEIDISKEEHMALAFAFEKKIDYEKLKNDYPEIYQLGLTTTFSKMRALTAMESKILLETVLKDCTKTKGKYKMKFTKRKVSKNAE